MATNTNQVTSNVSVVEKYNSLVKESIGGESIYIRAKETVQELVNDGAITDAQRAEVISNVISSAVNSITSSAMSAALDWAKYEKELALKKLEMDQQLSLLVIDGEIKSAQKAQIEMQTRLAQVESKRMYGTGTFSPVDGSLAALAEDGKVYEDIKLTRQQVTNATTENTLINTKVLESKAAVHKIVADTYVNYGAYTFNYNETGEGIAQITQINTDYKTLSDTQRDIAVEQGKGYTYNAWANALTGSASMLGTAIASDYFDFSADSPGSKLLTTVLSCADNLKNASGTESKAVPSS